MTAAESERAFEADPRPETARRFILELARERGGAYERLLHRLDEPERSFGALLWEAEGLPNDSARPVAWDALARLLDTGEDAARWLAPRHLLRAWDGPPSGLARRLARRFDGGELFNVVARHEGEDAVLRAYPGLRDVSLRGEVRGADLPRGLRHLELSGQSLAGLRSATLPELRSLTLSGAFPPEGLRALLATPLPAQVETLDIRDTLGPTGRFGGVWPALRRLTLEGAHWPNALPLSRHAPGLRELTLLQPRGALELGLAQLPRLELERLALISLSGAEVERLAASPVAERVVSLRCGALADPRALFAFPKLELLSVSEERGSASLSEHFAALAACGAPQRLRRLGGSLLDAASLDALCAQGPWVCRDLTWREALDRASAARLREALPQLESATLSWVGGEPEALRELFGGREIRIDLFAHEGAWLVEAADILAELPGLRLHVFCQSAEFEALSAGPLADRLVFVRIMNETEDLPGALARWAQRPLPRLEDFDPGPAPTPEGLRETLYETPCWPELRVAHRSFSYSGE